MREIDKEKISKEYLMGGTSYGLLGKKYGVSKATVAVWVKKYREQIGDVTVALNEFSQQALNPKALEKELENTQLENRLLKEILSIAEEELGVKIVKKFGAKR